jgi:hypothetical protein
MSTDGHLTSDHCYLGCHQMNIDELLDALEDDWHPVK